MGQRSSRPKVTTVTFGVADMKGRRPTMEDAHVLCKDVLGVRENYFFSVFDGHGGASVAKFCGSNILRLLSSKSAMKRESSTTKQLKGCLHSVYIELDAALRKYKPDGFCIADFCGCTAVSCLVTPTHYIVANLGDSRAILCRDGDPLPMSSDHKPYDEVEKTRIEAAGGRVYWGRVNGKLAVSRAVGDFVHKGAADVRPENQMVTIDADVKIFPREADDRFIVLACDGVWDVLSNEDVVKLVGGAIDEGESDCDILAKLVIEKAFEKGSSDNITAIVATISPFPSETPPTKTDTTKAGAGAGATTKKKTTEKTNGGVSECTKEEETSGEASPAEAPGG
eukprot:g3220.t1